MHERPHPEQEISAMFGSEESEISTLRSVLNKLRREREALGKIDSVQLTDDDKERIAELDKNIIAIQERIDTISPALDHKYYKKNNIRDLGDSVH